MLVSVVLILVCLVLFGWLQVVMRDRVAYGTKVAGFCISGASRAEAERRLTRAQELMGTATATLVTRKGVVKMKLADLGLKVDVPATVDAAVDGGRLNVLGLRLYWGRVPQVEPVVRFDAAAFGAAVAKLRPLVDTPPRNATLVLDGERVRVRAGARRHDDRPPGLRAPARRLPGAGCASTTGRCRRRRLSRR